VEASASTAGHASFEFDVACTAEPDAPADAFCTSCLRPFSERYLLARTDGRAICVACARTLDEPLHPLPGRTVRRDPALAGGWHRAVSRVITRPHRTFATPYDGPIAAAVVFGYVATLIGFASTTAWNVVFHGDALRALILENAPAAAALGESAANILIWAGTPLIAAFRLLIGAVLFHLGTRLIAGVDPPSLRSSIRVFALTSGTLMLCVIPMVGPFLALMTWFSATLAHLHAHHGLRTFRGLMALLPAFLVLAAIGPNTFVPV
jgi:hypothetical protein